MDTNVQKEKNRGRIEKRTAFVTDDVGWIPDRQAWSGLCCIGAIHTEFEEKGKKTSEWHYYISSRKLTALELLHHARMEWAVETMHWLLDVTFSEDDCRFLSENAHKSMIVLRKFALAVHKNFLALHHKKSSIKAHMLSTLLDPNLLLAFLRFL